MLVFASKLQAALFKGGRAKLFIAILLSCSWCRRLLQRSRHGAAGALVPGRFVHAFLQIPRPHGHTAPRTLAARSRQHQTDPWYRTPALRLPALLVPTVLPLSQDWRAYHEVSNGNLISLSFILLAQSDITHSGCASVAECCGWIIQRKLQRLLSMTSSWSVRRHVLFY